MSKWLWQEEPQGGGSQDGATFSKLMKDTQYSAEELLAREVIQNSWDASRKFVNEDPLHVFKIQFRFIKLSGQEAQNFRATYGLSEVGKSLWQAGQSEDGAAKEQYKHGVESLHSDQGDLKLLLIEDFGAHGLFGNPVGQGKKKSHLYKALYAVGVTGFSTEDNVRGGSYGFGKSAFIRASRANMAFAYTAFEQQDEDTATRRFVGATWWPGFTTNSPSGDLIDVTGLGIFGDPASEAGQGADRHRHPFVDDEADQIAVSMGFSERNPGQRSELGTSLLLVDPVVGAKELAGAIEKYWWPALVSPETKDQFKIEVFDYSDEPVKVDPLDSGDLQPFIASFQKLHLGLQGNAAPPTYLNQEKNFGVAFSALEESQLASIADEGLRGLDPVVALVRGPRMVIDYLAIPKRRPVPVRGVFATKFKEWDVDELLRQTEPPTHNHWSESKQTDVKSEATALAKRVHVFIKNKVKQYIDEIRPATAVETEHFEEFSDAFSSLFDGSKVVPPPPPGIQPNWRFGSTSLTEEDGKIKTEVKFDVRLSTGDLAKYKDIKLIFDFRMQEDAGNGPLIGCQVTDEAGSNLPLDGHNTSTPLSFVADQWRTFRVVTDPYEEGITLAVTPKIQAEEI